MRPYVVEVEVSTHEALRRGVLAVPRRLGGSTCTWVAVSPTEAPGGDYEAVLVACQVAAATSGEMPTAARLIDWPTPELESTP